MTRTDAIEDVDVVVVGLGPTGATLAGLLGQRGLRVAAFDRLADLYPLPRAIGFDHEFMRVMQELGIASRILPHTALYRPSEYRGVDGRVIKRLDMAAAPYRLGWAPNYVFDQPMVERELRHRLGEIPGVDVRLSAEVVATREVDDGVVVDVRLADDSTTRYRAKYVVACDGGSSPIRKRLGIELEDLDFDEYWLVIDVLVNDDVLDRLPQTQVQYCEPARPATFVIGPANHRRWELMVLPGDSLSDDFPGTELWPLLDRWIKPDEAQLWRAAAYRFHGLVASRWRQGRILLAGDSAHMTPPFMAQGMVQGIRDARNLAWKLALVVNAQASPDLLDTYGEERKPHVETVTALAIELGRVICERDPIAAKARDQRLIAEHGGVVPTTIRQSMLPSLCGGFLAADSAGAGEIFPQPMVTIDAATPSLLDPVLLDDVTGSTVLAVVIGGTSDRELSSLSAAMSAIGGRVVVVGPRPSPDVRTPWITVSEVVPIIEPWLRSLGSSSALVRPDRIVFGTAAGVDGALGLIAEYSDGLWV
jgi:3-(3-hydroxy-phenyl)propionate hydroxylase